MSLRFGTVDRYMLLGGGRLLTDLVELLEERGAEHVVVTSPRHLDAELLDRDGRTLGEHLRSEGIDHLVSDDVNTDPKVRDRVTGTTLGFSIGAAWIFRPPFIDLFDGRLLNLHGSRLPRDRGGGGFSWRILRGDRLGACLAHLVEPGVDTGDIVAMEEFAYPESCRTPADFKAHTLERYRTFLAGFLDRVEAGEEFEATPQAEHLSTYWPRLDTATHGHIDWSWDLDDIERFICAFDDPYPGARTGLGERTVRLKDCSTTAADGTFHPFQSGIVYRKTGDALYIACGEGSLVVGRLLDEEGRDVKDDVRVGDRFHTPREDLDRARSTRVIYTAEGRKRAPSASRAAPDAEDSGRPTTGDGGRSA